MKKCNLYGSLSTPPPNVHTCQIGTIEAIAVTVLETWRCLEDKMHRHKPTASRDFRTPLLIWVCPKMREIKHTNHSQSVGIPECPRYTHVHCSCKHRYVSAPLIWEFIAFIAARLQSFLCTWAIAPANHLYNGHSSGHSTTVATAWPWQWHQRNINSQNGRVWQES